MHTQRNRIFFFGSTALTGLASLGLHRYMMEHCFDHKGLLLAGNLPGTLLWVLGIGYLAALIVGGEAAALICTFIYKTIIPVIIKCSTAAFYKVCT